LRDILREEGREGEGERER
jgi:hypothetical protein